MKIKISDIQVPKAYIRKRKASHVAYLLEIAKTGKILDPIEIASNGVKKPTKVKKNGKTETIKPWELLDGQHRIKVNQLLKLPEINAIEKPIKDPGRRFLEQFKANSSHGLKLDLDERSQAIWEMVNTFKMQKREVAKQTGLHESSVGRIAARKQGWLGYKPDSMKRTRKDGDDPGAPEGGNVFEPHQFADHLAIMVNDYKKQKDKIVEALQAKFGAKLNDFVISLAAMVKEIHASVNK